MSPHFAIPPGLCWAKGFYQSLLPAGYPGPVACHPPRRVPPPFWPHGWPGPTALGLALSKRASRPPFQLLPAPPGPAHRLPAPAAQETPVRIYRPLSGTHRAHPTELSPVCPQHRSGPWPRQTEREPVMPFMFTAVQSFCSRNAHETGRGDSKAQVPQTGTRR